MIDGPASKYSALVTERAANMSRLARIDPPIHVAGSSGPLSFGDLVPVKIVDAMDYELTGVTTE